MVMKNRTGAATGQYSRHSKGDIPGKISFLTPVRQPSGNN